MKTQSAGEVEVNWPSVPLGTSGRGWASGAILAQEVGRLEIPRVRREMVGDDLDHSIEETVAEHPEFDEMLDAAIGVRELVRRLAEARTRAGLTQTEVARRMGSTQPAVARLGAGDLDPRLSTVERYAQVVGIRLHAVVV